MTTTCIRSISIAAIAGLALGLCLGGIIRAQDPTSRPTAATTSSPAPTSAPTSKPAKTKAKIKAEAKAETKYPSGELVEACKLKSRMLRRKLDDSFRIIIAEPFIIAGAMGQRRLAQYAEGSVTRPAKAMWASYFKNKPTRPITVLLFTGDKQYRAWAKKLFNDRDLPHFGYYRPTDETLVMNIATGTGTLVHELTHALIVYDFPAVPPWFNEGLASLHEQCSVGEKKIVGLTNWRLPALQRAARAGKLRPLADLVTKRDFYGRHQGLNYAQARYFVMYLQHQGLLQNFYTHFRANHTAPAADIKAIEHTFSNPTPKKLPQIEQSYLRYLTTLRHPS